MHKKSGLIYAMWLVLLSPAQAATEVELINERTVDGETHSYIINSVYQGNNSRFTLHDPDDSTTGAGVYVLSNDGGKTAFYIDTNDNNCHRWTNEEFTQNLSTFLLESKRKFNVKVSDLNVDKLLEEPSESMLDLPTTHVRYALSFNASYKYMFFKGQYAVERQTDYWTTPKIESITTPIPLFQNIGQHAGEGQVDQQLSDIFASNVGFRLRSELLQTTTDKKGKKSSTKMVQYIKTLNEVENLPDNTFDVPDCEGVGAKKMEKKFNALLKDLIS